MKKDELARMIDHTLLGPTSTADGVRRLCEEAVRFGVAAVCVDPCHAAVARGQIAETAVRLCVVVGFPHGMATPEVKAFEAQKAIAAGAEEIDMVTNIAALRAGDYAAVLADVRGVTSVAAAAPRPVAVKVILETALLDEGQKIAGAILAKAAGAAFVKTSTGFGPAGATVEDVELLRRTVGPAMGVKAAGGIRDATTALVMIAAGATRIGASRTAEILAGLSPST